MEGGLKLGLNKETGKVALVALLVLKLYHDGHLGVTGLFKGAPSPESKKTT